MGFQCGIIGLPNVGKSTIFNALTANQVPAENYPFCTVDPNIGVVEVPDDRLERIAEVYHPQKVTPTTLQFVDIAGLVKGASKGEGLGNQFLAQIREVDAIAHVVRCFEDEDVSHVSGTIDPANDIEIVNTELYLRDLETLEKRIEKVAKQAKTGDKEARLQVEVYRKAYHHLSGGHLLRTLDLTGNEQEILAPLFLLSFKPVLYVANVQEEEITTGEPGPHTRAVLDYARAAGTGMISLCGKLEADIAMLPQEEKALFLEEYGLREPGLNKLIRTGYDLLNLITFFTVNPNEGHAWTVQRGARAPEAAGKVHTDFQKGFIKAEVFGFQDLEAYGSEKSLREHGLLRQEGRDYVVKDGDVLFFKFNV